MKKNECVCNFKCRFFNSNKIIDFFFEGKKILINQSIWVRIQFKKIKRHSDSYLKKKSYIRLKLNSAQKEKKNTVMCDWGLDWIDKTGFLDPTRDS